MGDDSLESIRSGRITRARAGSKEIMRGAEPEGMERFLNDRMQLRARLGCLVIYQLGSRTAKKRRVLFGLVLH